VFRRAKDSSLWAPAGPEGDQRELTIGGDVRWRLEERCFGSVPVEQRSESRRETRPKNLRRGFSS